MKSYILAAAMIAAPLGASDIVLLDGPAVDPRDRMIAEGSAMPAADWIGEPWWVPLGECAVVFRQAPVDTAKSQQFVTAGMTRIIADRQVKANDAAAVMAGWMRGLGGERALVRIALFTFEPVRESCDRLLSQYQAG